MVTWVFQLELIAEYMPMLREHRCMWVQNAGTRMAQGKSRIWEAFGWVSLNRGVVGSKEVFSSSAPRRVTCSTTTCPENILSAFFHSVDWALRDRQGQGEASVLKFYFSYKPWDALYVVQCESTTSSSHLYKEKFMITVAMKWIWIILHTTLCAFTKLLRLFLLLRVIWHRYTRFFQTLCAFWSVYVYAAT